MAAIAFNSKTKCNIISQVNFKSCTLCSYNANNGVIVMFAVNSKNCKNPLFNNACKRVFYAQNIFIH